MWSIILTIFLMYGICSAADVKLSWDTPPGDWQTNIYCKHGGQADYGFGFPVAVSSNGVNTATIENLVPGETYFFVATHYDMVTRLESDPSNEVSFTVPVPPEKVVTELEVPAVRKYKITLEVVE